MRPSIGLPILHAWPTRDGEAFDVTCSDLNGGDNLDRLYLGVELTTRAVGRILSKDI